MRKKNIEVNLRLSRLCIVLFLIIFLASNSCGFLDIKYRLYGNSPAQTGQVKVYSFSNGEKGKLLDEVTLENNQFHVALLDTDGAVLFELGSFSVYDNVNDEILESGPDIKWQSLVVAPDFYSQYNINPITTIAAALAIHEINKSNFHKSKDVIDIITNSNRIVGSHFGSIDILKTTPSKLDVTSKALDEPIKYGLSIMPFMEISHYMMASLAKKWDLFSMNPLNIINMTQSIKDDVLHDGYVDGQASYGTTSLQNETATDKLLKFDFARSVFRLLQNPSYNKTGLYYEDSLSFLDNLTLSASQLFRPGSPRFPFDTEPPVIVCSSPIQGEIYSFSIEIICTIEDEMPGIDNNWISFNGQSVKNLVDSKNDFYAVVSLPSDISTANISIVSQDRIGNKSSLIRDIYINN